MKKLPILALLTVSSLLSVAHAATAKDISARTLPPASSTHDPLPPAPSPVAGQDVGLVEQAGVGGDVAYARGGVLELGGNIDFSQQSGQTSLSVAPSVGWFFTDNVELTGIVRGTYTRVGGNQSTAITALVEPSIHLPISDAAFVFGGVGLGGAFTQGGPGLAIAPRIGFNFLIGRSGVLTPALAMNWSSNDSIKTPDRTLLAVSTVYSANIGYTVMW